MARTLFDDAAQDAVQESPAPTTLSALKEAEDACQRCPLYRDATQVVPGEGRPGAHIMLVGEQPGDQEDLAGRPFVGPAGRLLDRALEDAGIPREEAFVTNAVKHFKHEMRGKRRLHKRPNAYEVDRCNWWLQRERAIVKPSLIVALGATAVRGVTGKAGTITSLRGKVFELDDGTKCLVTIHPSALLRIQEEEDKKAEYKRFVKDLELAARVGLKKAA